METDSAFGFNELFGFVLSDIAKAVSERSGETQEQQFLRFQAAVHMVMSFLPRDTNEVILAGHCILMHETMLASTHDTLRGEADTTRNATRGNLVALNREFNSNLRMLQHYQARPSQGRRDGPVAPPAEAQTAAGGVVPPPGQVPSAGTEAATAPAAGASGRDLDSMVVHLPDATVVYRPSAAAVAECRANPEAMAALDAGDAEAFARALGIEIPSEAFLEAANTPGSPFDRKAAGPWPANSVPKVRKA